MATKKVWLGSTGPFLFDDEVLYIDEEGVIAPDNQQAIATNGQIVVQSPPTSPVHVVRKAELDNIATILGLGTMAYQNANAVNITGGAANLSDLVVTDLGSFNLVQIAQAVVPGYSLTTGSLYVGSVSYFVGPVAIGWTQQGGYELTTNRLYVAGASYFGSHVTFNSTIGVVSAAIGYTAQAGYALTVNQIYAAGASLFNSNLTVNGVLNVPPSSLNGGLLIPDVASSDRIGIRLQVTTGTNKWGIYSDGTAPHYLNGNVGIGVVSPANVRLAISFPAGFYGTNYAPIGALGNTWVPIQFLRVDGVTVGSITSTDTATNFNTTSDRRLKYDTSLITNALDVISLLRPSTGLWKTNNRPWFGFLADELQEVCPECVTGEADAVDENDSIIPQQVDHSKLVPWLAAAMQELIQQVKDLNARVADLEAA